MRTDFRRKRYPNLYRAAISINPLALLDRVARVVTRSPQGAILCLFVATLVTGLATWGIRAVSRLPVELAFVIAAMLISLQILLLSAIKASRYGLRIRATLVVFFLLIATWNMTSIAGGATALQPDKLGRAFIQQQLSGQTVLVATGVGELTTLADAMDRIAKYSADSDATERGTGPGGWRPTCPGSARPGPGDFAHMREADAVAITGPPGGAPGLAPQIRILATRAQNAMAAAGKARDGYRLADHEKVMADLRKQTDIARTALASPVIAEAISWLAERRDQIKKGRPLPNSRLAMCEDDQLRRLINRAIDVSAGPGKTILRVPPSVPNSFVEPERPDERTAVMGLANQLSNGAIVVFMTILSWFGYPVYPKVYPGVDLSPWAYQLIGGPLLDVLLMVSLKMLDTGAKREPTLDAEVAERTGQGDVDPEEIQPARARAMRGEYMAKIEGYLHVRARRWTVASMFVVPLEDSEFIDLVDNLVTQGRAIEGGIGFGDAIPQFLADGRVEADQRYRTVVLRPKMLRRLIDEEIVRQVLAGREERSSAPSASPSPSQGRRATGSSDAADDTVNDAQRRTV